MVDIVRGSSRANSAFKIEKCALHLSPSPSFSHSHLRPTKRETSRNAKRETLTSISISTPSPSAFTISIYIPGDEKLPETPPNYIPSPSHKTRNVPKRETSQNNYLRGRAPPEVGLAEAYQRLTLPIKRRLAARLWDIVTGATPIPPEWANLVHPLYKKGDWAQPGNWRPIVCATTEVKLVWTLILGCIAPAVFAHVPASMWGAMAGRSPHEAILLQDTAMDMNPCEMIITSRDVQGAFPHAPHLLLTEVWDAMGLPFLPFMTGYITTQLYAIITAASLTPWTGTHSGVPQGGTEGPFLYLLVTLPLAFELAREYPAYAPYPLRFPLVNFADDNLLTTATRHHDPSNAGQPTATGLPTATDQASAILQFTTSYLDAHQLLVHPRKSVGLADTGAPAPDIRKDEPLRLESTTIHLGVTQATRHHDIALPNKL